MGIGWIRWNMNIGSLPRTGRPKHMYLMIPSWLVLFGVSAEIHLVQNDVLFDETLSCLIVWDDIMTTIFNN